MKEKLKTVNREILMTSDDINLQPTKIHEKKYNDIIKTAVYWNHMEGTGTIDFWQVTQDHSIIITLLHLLETILTSYFSWLLLGCPMVNFGSLSSKQPH